MPDTFSFSSSTPVQLLLFPERSFSNGKHAPLLPLYASHSTITTIFAHTHTHNRGGVGWGYGRQNETSVAACSSLNR